MTTRARFTDGDLTRARAVHPAEFQPPDAKRVGGGRDGRMELRVGGERYRIDPAKSGGAWLAFVGNAGPLDSIQLHQRWHGTTFPEAVHALNGTQPARRRGRAAPAAPAFSRPAPRVSAPVADDRPPGAPNPDFSDPTAGGTTDAARAAGRDYLERVRGISAEVIDKAERQGAISYSQRGVVFIARDESGTPRAAETRLLRPFRDRESGKLIKALTHPGSQKRWFPLLLRGGDDNAATLIVEGGTDALAVHELARREGRPEPTVIATGGARVADCLRTPHVAEILRATTGRIVIAREREKSPETQTKTDAAHDAQIAVVREIVGADGAQIGGWMPPADCSDIADMVKPRRLNPPNTRRSSPRIEPQPLRPEVAM